MCWQLDTRFGLIIEFILCLLEVATNNYNSQYLQITTAYSKLLSSLVCMLANMMVGGRHSSIIFTYHSACLVYCQGLQCKAGLLVLQTGKAPSTFSISSGLHRHRDLEASVPWISLKESFWHVSSCPLEWSLEVLMHQAPIRLRSFWP
jgi:hypothetical protein